MPSHNLHDVVLRAAGVPGRIRAASDGDLLGWFVAERNAAAFAELVRRHGSMVLGVARRELGNTPDADDACQATFLVLARKAAAVRRGSAVGAWLYGVARRVARKTQRKRLASRERERPESYLESNPPAAPGSHDPPTRAALSELLLILDEELGRLPGAYRAPLVLCYLEGRTQDEAARQLGWTLGSFRGRLERGRARLRDRLTRRGVGLAVLAAVSVVRPERVAAAVQSSIINTAAAIVAGEALAIPAGVVGLAEGEMGTMVVAKLQWAAGVVAVCGMLTVGGVWAIGQGPGGKPTGPVLEGPGAPEGANYKAPVVKTDKPLVPVFGRSFVVVPLRTELHRHLIHGADDNSAAIVILDGTVLFADLAKIDPAALELEGMQKALAGLHPNKQKAIHFRAYLGPPPNPTKAGTDLLELALDGLGYRVGFGRSKSIYSWVNAPFDWQAFIAPLRAGSDGGADSDEPALGNDAVRVYMVRTPLSRALAPPGVSCLIDILKPIDGGSGDQAWADAAKAAKTVVAPLKLPFDTKAAINVRFKRGTEPDVERVRKSLLQLADSLAIQLGSFSF